MIGVLQKGRGLLGVLAAGLILPSPGWPAPSVWTPPAAAVPTGWHAVTLEIEPAEAGAVDLWPYGGAYRPGTEVRVRARARDGFAFSHWEGAVAGAPRADTDPFVINSPLTVRAVFAPLEPPVAVVQVANLSQLSSAIAAAVPGTVIECADGTYTLGSALTITRQGTPTRPIVIRARNRGGATFTGSAGLVLNGARHVVIEGFVFVCTMKTAVDLKDAQHCRVTRNTFLQGAATISQWWVTLSGATGRHNRIDFNRFEGKRTMGNYLSTTTRQGIDLTLSEFDVIERNAFIDIGPNEGNGKEAIRLGNSWISMAKGFTLVESNYFELCDGDAEVVSNKSCDNIFRWNTFINNWGSLCLRHGNRCVADGNTFIRPDEIIDWSKVDASLPPELRRIGGLRAYGDDHVIINNTFYQTNAGTTGLGTLVLCSGRVNWTEDHYPAGDLSSTNAADRIFVAYNTFADAPRTSIDIGYSSGGTTFPANEMIFYNNLIVARQGRNPGKLIYLPSNVPAPTGTVWRGNIAYAAGGVTLGDWPVAFLESELRVANPQIHKPLDRWTVPAGSVAVGAAATDDVPHRVCVPWDFDGQPRDTPGSAVGADHLSSAPIRNRVLTPADVGPDAPVDLTEAYPAWVYRHDLSPSEAGLLHAPADDGVANLLSYALGLDPKSNKQHLLPKPLLTGADGTPPASGESRFVALDLSLNPSATGVTGLPEVSGDLMLWSSGEDDLRILEQSPKRLLFRDATPIEAGQPGRFIRFRVGSP